MWGQSRFCSTGHTLPSHGMGQSNPPTHPNSGITALSQEAPDRSSLPRSQQPEEQGQPVECPSGAAAPSRTPWHRDPDPHSSHPCCQGSQGHQLPFHTREKLLYRSLRVIMASNAAGCPSPGAALCPPSRAPTRPLPGHGSLAQPARTAVSRPAPPPTGD